MPPDKANIRTPRNHPAIPDIRPEAGRLTHAPDLDDNGIREIVYETFIAHYVMAAPAKPSYFAAAR